VRLNSGDAGRGACDQARERGGQVLYLGEWGAFGHWGPPVNLTLYVRELPAARYCRVDRCTGHPPSNATVTGWDGRKSPKALMTAIINRVLLKLST
jgi:hypothetical protein